MTDELKTRADDLARALRDLHKALIHAEAGDDPAFENPYTLLFAVIGNPRFSWLEGLSQLIVLIDEARADKEGVLTEAVLADAVASAKRLIGEGEDHDPQFRLRHLMAVQNAPDVAITTGKLRNVLAELGSPVQ
ncbi:hypothetical protein GTW25_13930 [Aliihoeflea aestuarii]|jgi:hypothetical protein|uniref:hypothetical protein n=1 Tax=Aliihoeflea aestuarii TaxID=453840 RepID=UPI0020946B36|nr:hypothetical protein [Aliihoeflea aestuarii]MCO6392131.1 hypothetical protein [Aliihoeflea aestuarii]